MNDLRELLFPDIIRPREEDDKILAVFDAAMAEWRARCRMVDNPTSENCDAWNEAVDAANEACRKAEEVES